MVLNLDGTRFRQLDKEIQNSLNTDLKLAYFNTESFRRHYFINFTFYLHFKYKSRARARI